MTELRRSFAPEVIVGDITALDVDAIVNAANRDLAPGGGVCGAIHRAAGPKLAASAMRLGPCETGDARLTAGFDLPAAFVIHAVGPVWLGGSNGEADLLASCYRRSLSLAAEQGAGSIAFPCISTGIFGYPMRSATDVALATIRAWRAAHDVPERVICCCFSDADAAVYRAVLAELSD
jgi:O-acetyl-ADP-ribose deacetylase (regulator of RNase III)